MTAVSEIGNSFVYASSLSAIDSSNTRFALVNPIASFTPRLFFTHLLLSLNIQNTNPSNLHDFLHGLSPLPLSPPIVIAVERAESLRQNFPDLIVPLSRLAELARLPIITVFISTISWLDWRPPLGASPDPFYIDVQPSSKQETIHHLSEIFLKTSATHEGKNTPYNSGLLPLYQHFAQVLYSACAPFTQDSDELAYIAAARWPGFIQPLLDQQHPNDDDLGTDGTATDMIIAQPTEDTRIRLTRLFAPSFTAALEALLPRLTNAAAWARDNMPPPNLLAMPPNAAATALAPLLDERALHQRGRNSTNISSLRLPRMAKFILVAAFLASTNPPKSDLRMFGRGPDERGGGRRRRKGGGAAATRKSKGGPAKVPQRLLGPAPFPLDRLLAILSVLLDEYDTDSRLLGPEETPALEVSRIHVSAMVRPPVSVLIVIFIIIGGFLVYCYWKFVISFWIVILILMLMLTLGSSIHSSNPKNTNAHAGDGACDDEAATPDVRSGRGRRGDDDDGWDGSDVAVRGVIRGGPRPRTRARRAHE